MPRPALPKYAHSRSGAVKKKLALLCAALFLMGSVALCCAAEDATKVTLLKNGEYGEALLKGIHSARRSILVSSYIFRVTNSRRNFPAHIARELVSARQRGVNVTVILEKPRSSRDDLNRENLHTAAILARGGVKVFFDSPNVVTHAKAVVIDDRYVYIGSHNLTQSALTRNNELSVLLDSPEIAADIRDYLNSL